MMVSVVVVQGSRFWITTTRTAIKSATGNRYGIYSTGPKSGEKKKKNGSVFYARFFHGTYITHHVRENGLLFLLRCILQNSE